MFLKILHPRPYTRAGAGDRKAERSKTLTAAGIKYQYGLAAITMNTLRYKILLREEDDGTYTVIVPSLPGCLTFGRSAEEALAMAEEAIEGFVACMIARGEKVPVEADGVMMR